MPDLIKILGDDEAPDTPVILEEFRLGEDDALAILFTSDADEARLHFEADPAVNSYVVCPGPGCPACYSGSAPKPVALLPVYSVEDESVRVLRISTRRGPHSLASVLLPFFKDPGIHDKLLVIRRLREKYFIAAKELPQHAARGEGAIRRFLAARDGGLSLASAFMRMTCEEYAQVERIRRKLEALGGMPMGSADGVNDDGEGDDGEAEATK